MNTKKTILVTGASSGIGKATVKQLLRDGHTVYGAARRVYKMKLLEELGAFILEMDITNEEDIRKVVRQIEDVHGGVDVLVNNAGYAVYGAIEDTPVDEARHQFEVNLFGLATLTQHVLPYMREQGSGTIINMSSMGGIIHTLLGGWYHASKHALEGWSDCLRMELAPFGINVVIIEPGIIETEFGDVSAGPLLERSGDTDYGKLAQRATEAIRRSYAKGAGSPPEIIAKTISKAIAAKKPKTRYAKGKMAKPLILLRKLLPDRLFDKLVLSQT